MDSKENYFNAKEFNNIKEIIYNSAKVYEKQSAFVIKHKNGKEVSYEDISYKKLLEDINKLGTAFYDKGYKNKRIAVVGVNRYEWVITHLANLLGGIVSVPLDKGLQIEELENSLARSKAELVVFDKKLVDEIKQINLNNKTEVKEYVCMDDIDNFESISELLKKGEKLIAQGNNEFINAQIDNNKMAILLFTSGTTSKAKAVMLSNKNVASNVFALQCVEDIRSTDTNIAFLPFHHIFGSTLLLLVLACGTKTVFTDGLKYIKQNLKEYKVTMFVGVPLLIEAIYKAMTKTIEKQGKTKIIKLATAISNFLLKLHIDIRRKIFKQVIDELGGELRIVISGGAPADPKVSKAFNDMGIETLQGYGLSETSPVISGENFKYKRNGTVGKPMPNNIIEIVNKDKDGIGEIRVKGPNVMLGYYDMQEKTAEVLKDGFFYTGDLGFFDKDGFLHLTGRNKDMIVLKNGKKVFPEEVETLINRIDLVSECMVFGLPKKDDINDIKLSAKVVIDKQEAKEKYSGKSLEELKEIIWNEIKKINTTFPKYKHIQNLIVSEEELIKTTTKKVKRNEEMKKILGE